LEERQNCRIEFEIRKAHPFISAWDRREAWIGLAGSGIGPHDWIGRYRFCLSAAFIAAATDERVILKALANWIGGNHGISPTLIARAIACS
jgi:hypothetical protein